MVTFATQGYFYLNRNLKKLILTIIQKADVLLSIPSKKCWSTIACKLEGNKIVSYLFTSKYGVH